MRKNKEERERKKIERRKQQIEEQQITKNNTNKKLATPRKTDRSKRKDKPVSVKFFWNIFLFFLLVVYCNSPP